MKVKSESEVAQSCPNLRDPMDCSLPGASVHGIFQARVLEWGAISFSMILWEFFKKGFIPFNNILITVEEGVEKRKLLCTVGGNVNWNSHYGK